MKYVILGGTGTLGTGLVHRLMLDESNKITVFSRDEVKQAKMRQSLDTRRISFVLGDIRDPDSLRSAFNGADRVFHVAALKRVDTLEENPQQSILTNIIGTQNVADAAISSGVPRVFFSSTDKAVQPVNVYGMSKAISERLLLHKNKVQDTTRFVVFRWGNVVGSRGSVIETFAKTLWDTNRAALTHPDMSRFWLRIEDAVTFMLQHCESREGLVIPTMKAARVSEVIRAIASVAEIEGYENIITGLRAGEKIHESILPGITSENSEQFSFGELCDLIRPAVRAIL